MFNKADLSLLNSYKAIEYLIQSDKPDFKETLKELRFNKELIQLQIKLLDIQDWVVENKKRVMILVEGREFAGKGGAIQLFTEHLNPRSLRKVALKAPTEEERGQWYFKRYVKHIAEQGEMVFFDRSWYNRALVEPVNGFCSSEEYTRFMKEVNQFERMLTKDGIILVKIYFSISKKEQERRIKNVQKNPLRRWELTPVDKQAVELWDTYTKYEKKMIKVTHTKMNPWIIIKSDNSRVASMKAFKEILKLFPVKK
jgi:polyphosphate kinase 2